MLTNTHARADQKDEPAYLVGMSASADAAGPIEGSLWMQTLQLEGGARWREGYDHDVYGLKAGLNISLQRQKLTGIGAQIKADTVFWRDRLPYGGKFAAGLGFNKWLEWVPCDVCLNYVEEERVVYGALLVTDLHIFISKRVSIFWEHAFGGAWRNAEAKVGPTLIVSEKLGIQIEAELFNTND